MIPVQKTTNFLDDLILRLSLENKSDAIAKQFVPSLQENILHPDFSDDPLQEETLSPLPRLFHKYPDKILINTIDTCSILCRFCTRKRNTQKNISSAINSKQTDAIARYIVERKNINEIILSGGEVFLLSDKKITDILKKVVSEQIEIIRFHTRLPTVDPSQFSQKISLLVRLKKKYPKKKIVLVFHLNHSLEITVQFEKIVARLRQEEFILKAQGVLLKDINDDVQTLHSLFSNLHRIGVQPYYLHHLDKISGAAHFFVEYARGLQLVESLKNIEDKSYVVPRYVKDSPQGKKDVKLDVSVQVDPFIKNGQNARKKTS